MKKISIFVISLAIVATGLPTLYAADLGVRGVGIKGSRHCLESPKDGLAYGLDLTIDIGTALGLKLETDIGYWSMDTYHLYDGLHIYSLLDGSYRDYSLGINTKYVIFSRQRFAVFGGCGFTFHRRLFQGARLLPDYESGWEVLFPHKFTYSAVAGIELELIKGIKGLLEGRYATDALILSAGVLYYWK